MGNENEILQKAPEIGAEQITLLERLSNACGVSGDEAEVRAIVLEQLKPVADEIKVDALGNVLVTRKAKVEKPLRVMLAAHMDEVGFMLVDSDDNGTFSFAPVGGIDARTLVGKPVLVGKEHVMVFPELPLVAGAVCGFCGTLTLRANPGADGAEDKVDLAGADVISEEFWFGITPEVSAVGALEVSILDDLDGGVRVALGIGRGR